jgi:hypothetical protein
MTDQSQTQAASPDPAKSTANPAKAGSETQKGAKEQTIQYEVPYYVLDPQYAIGMGIISQQEYSSLRDEYYTQARTLTGIAIPLIGLMLYMGFGTDQSWGVFPYFVISFVTVCGMVAGLDRLHKFYSELQMLIIGHYLAKKMADEKAASQAAQNVTKTYLEKELKKEFDKQLIDIKGIVKGGSENPGGIGPAVYPEPKR